MIKILIKILIVEDSFATRVCYRLWCEDLLEQAGLSGVTHEVRNQAEAEAKLTDARGAPYDLAIIDISFPTERTDLHGRTVVEMDPSAGLKLCEVMGRRHAETPIIVASSTRMDAEAVDFLNDKAKCPTVEAYVIELFTQERFLEIALPLLRRRADQGPGNAPGD